MKKIYCLVLSVIALISVCNAQYINISDPGFRSYLKNLYPGCFNSADMLDTTCTQILSEDSIDFQTSYSLEPINNIDGIQYFKSLTYLSCRASGVFHIGILPKKIKYFDCSASGIVKLPPLPDFLRILKCESSGLAELPALPPFLERLECKSNGILHVPPLPSTLKYLDCSTNPLEDIPDLSGTSLEYLECGSTGGMPVESKILKLPNTVKYISCSGAGITEIISLPDSLQFLNCQGNSVTHLPALPANLEKLYCSDTYINILPALPEKLSYLQCGSNSYIDNAEVFAMTSLPQLPQSLRTLNCGKLLSTSIPVLPDSLTSLSLYIPNINSLSATVIPTTLTNLNISHSPITSLPALPDSLKGLSIIDCKIPYLSKLPVGLKTLTFTNDSLLQYLPELPAGLSGLYCTGCPSLTALPKLPDSLTSLDCVGSSVYCFPRLPQGSLSGPFGFMGIKLSINYDADKIKCFPNLGDYMINGQDIRNINTHVPLCTPINNEYHCHFSPIISGRTFYDNNSNGIKDIGELYKPNISVQLSNNYIAYTDNGGYFELSADTGSYSITVNSPSFYTALPSVYNYHFTNYDTIVSVLIPLQPTATVDSMMITVTPTNWAARPGFSYPYLISYDNIGTITLSPDISFEYDNTRLVLDSISKISVVNLGNKLSLHEFNFVPGERRSFVAYFTLKPTVTLSDTLISTATISANSALATFVANSPVRGSFDPNVKDATPELTPQQVAAGKYINYTIRFQNTGTDTAFNVVVTDTLSNLLQEGTVEILNTSHSCNITRDGNKIVFEFLNILLPDSNVNEPGSHGFVTFRVKPRSTVINGNVISNKAAIYFDYNLPVITNTATTNIKTPATTVPLKLIAFTALNEKDNKATLYWNSTNEINTKYFVIEQSVNSINFTGIGTVVAKGNGNNTYMQSVTKPVGDIVYYRLKMIDVNGQYSYSPVLKLNNSTATEAISILTNPIKDIITIKVADASFNKTEGRIINTQGMVVKRFILQQGVTTVDVSSLATGSYYLQTKAGSNKIVVSK